MELKGGAVVGSTNNLNVYAQRLAYFFMPPTGYFCAQAFARHMAFLKKNSEQTTGDNNAD